MWIRGSKGAKWHYQPDDQTTFFVCGLSAPQNIYSRKATDCPKHLCCEKCYTIVEARRMFPDLSQDEAVVVLSQLKKEREEQDRARKAELSALSSAKKVQRIANMQQRFIETIRQLDQVRQDCEQWLQEYQDDNKTSSIHYLTTTWEMVDAWYALCTRCFQRGKSEPGFMSPILSEFSHRGHACTLRSLRKRVLSAKNAFHNYKNVEAISLKRDAFQRSLEQERRTNSMRSSAPQDTPEQRTNFLTWREKEAIRQSEKEQSVSQEERLFHGAESGQPGNPTHRRR